MYLKEIEILGFKSFADKTVITLDNDVTCVVGPNGSGKSNVVDAIRWVLGEQSVKSLRGDNSMSDFIFSGSKSRNPLNVASVMLTFDNSDHYVNMPYNEISVKRRLYRNGENEYFINGEKVRLKDVTELFLDTGIGKSSFSIIGQGDIGKIFSSSSLERRSVLEEAAGILKYKTRREEALRKLDRTDNNIERVNDIIGELEQRVEPLRIQSEKAREYLDIKHELKEIDVSLTVDDISNIYRDYSDYKNRIESINKEIIELNTKISNSIVDKLKLDRIELEKKINVINDKLVLLTKEEEELNSQRKLIKERSKYDSNDIKVHENIMVLKESKLKLEKDIDLIENELNLKNIEFEESKKEIISLTNELNEIKTKKDFSNREYSIKNKEYIENKNKISVLRDSIESNSLISSNSKRVLDNPRLNGVKDCFGNIVSCEDRYTKALEVIISSIKSVVICDDMESVKECINYLKNNNLGRCTFYPMDVMKPRVIDPNTLDLLEREIDYLGVLSDFVKYDDIYSNVVLNQFGNIIVTSDIDSANNLGRIVKNKYRIVTLNGDIINAGGSVTGGSINNIVSPISLKNQLTDLILKNNTLENVNNDLSNEINRLESDIIKLEETITNKRKNNNDLFDSISNLNNNKGLKENDLRNIDIELSNLDSLNNNSINKEEELITEKYYSKQKEKELVVLELNNLNKDYDKLNINILDLEGLDKVNNSELNSKQKSLSEYSNELARMDIKLDNLLNYLSSEYEISYEKAKDLYSLDMENAEAHKLVNKYKNKLKEIGMVNIDSIDEFKEVNTRYEFLTNQRNDLFNAKDTLVNIINEMDTVMKEDFKNTFEVLKVEFNKVFRELFNGGEAELILTDPDDLLNTGVDIKATPPGETKKPITLLSGGQKTFTAIALVFAILNIKKIPFCVFDEIEAALDESNVDIFGHYLDHYKSKTQFLLITHKKRTMEYAKNLYGMTMQELGVSKLVSVKFEE